MHIFDPAHMIAIHGYWDLDQEANFPPPKPIQQIVVVTAEFNTFLLLPDPLMAISGLIIELFGGQCVVTYVVGENGEPVAIICHHQNLESRVTAAT